MNEKKICFIICSNNKMLLDECFEYISRLYIPEGYETDAIVVNEATSMTSGYNEAMRATDAKYKIYMHQDVFIVNRFFLLNLVQIFETDDRIGAVGMVGVQELGRTGCMWLNSRYGIHNVYGSEKRDYSSVSLGYAVEENVILSDVLVTDGLLIATSADVEWDEDFDGWDFYDASQGVRFNQRGYRVVVPEQELPWFVHDDGRYLGLWNYDKYRKLFLRKYGKIYPELEQIIKSRK